MTCTALHSLAAGNERTTDNVFVAAELGRCDKIKQYKAARHFDIDAVDNLGRSALMWASDAGQLDAVELLLRLGADVQLTDILTGR
jgi:ankyrin repeat protein